MSDKDRIEELEKRVKELEARPIFYPVPGPIYIQPIMPPIYPQPQPWYPYPWAVRPNITWTTTIFGPNSTTSGYMESGG